LPNCYYNESEAWAFHEIDIRELNPSCDWGTTYVYIPWFGEYCWNGYGANNVNCNIVTSYLEYINTPATILGCTNTGSTSIRKWTNLTCPIGYVADQELVLCKRTRVDACRIGNPLVPVGGEKRQEEGDFVAADPFPLSIVRHYGSGMGWSNYSIGLPSTDLGTAWRHNYQRYIGIPIKMPTVAWVVRPQSQPRYFDKVGSTWVRRDCAKDKLIELLDGGGSRTGWRYVTDEDEFEEYDAAGRLLSITNREGKVQTVAYNGDGLVASVSDPFGRAISFGYSGKLLTSVSDLNGAAYTYAYNANRLLDAVQAPDLTTRQYRYNETPFAPGPTAPAHNEILTGVVDESNTRFATYSYSSGRAVSSEHAGGVNKWTIDYGSGLFVPRVKDPLFNTRIMTYTLVAGSYRNTAVSAACAHCGDQYKSTAYDANGNVTARTDFNNKVTCYANDLGRNLETARAEGILNTESCATVLATLPNRPDVRKVSTQWHPVWNKPTAVAEPKRITKYAFNGDGGVYCAPTGARVGGYPIGVLCKETITETTDATGQLGLAATLTAKVRITRFTYNDVGDLLTTTDPRGKVTTLAYFSSTDADPTKRGRLATVTSPVGHVTSIDSYDANGRVLAVTDPNGVQTTSTYTPRGRLATRTTARRNDDLHVRRARPARASHFA
jgi:YD repeat-containing protein